MVGYVTFKEGSCDYGEKTGRFSAGNPFKVMVSEFKSPLKGLFVGDLQLHRGSKSHGVNHLE